ncbi:MAG: DUF4111 domain-containing protein [Chloroflexi bacterium]|nr:DUF4111 domain-containing protein [Chloroflexota bacterium]MBU1748509.1 DUF4111 domain-containing protein [Chloroflexota bacterium]
MQPPKDIQDLCRAFADGLGAALGSNLYGVYLYGAVAFDAGPTGDIDFHVILNEPPGDEERAAIERLHARLARDFPPLGGELDGYYILLDDARQQAPPGHLLLPHVIDNSWALHRAHIRAGRCIVLHGPDPLQVYPPASWPELEDALQGELNYVQEHLDAYPAYCILNLCRLVYSFETRDVVTSKAAAAAWAVDAVSQWQPLIEAAQRAYAHQSTAQDEALMRSKVPHLFQFACQRIRVARGLPHHTL